MNVSSIHIHIYRKFIHTVIDIKSIMLWKNKELENKEENCQKNKL